MISFVILVAFFVAGKLALECIPGQDCVHFCDSSVTSDCMDTSMTCIDNEICSLTCSFVI